MEKNLVARSTSMVIDGKEIANSVYQKLSKVISGFPRPPRIDIIIVGQSPVVESFIKIKKHAAARIGVVAVEHRFRDDITEEDLLKELKKISVVDESDGIIVQLPLPKSINAQLVLDAIPPEKDVDVLSTKGVALFAQEKSKILPPVAGAVKEILDSAGVKVHSEEVLILGFGRLVGKPVSIFMRHNDAHVTVVDAPIVDLAALVRDSLVVVSGVGSPCLITPEMVTAKHVLIDAGTSESEGKLAGDIDPRVAPLVSLYTPVPGGVGPVTVAMLFKNLCVLALERMHSR